jgi:outer membrane protein OmpA-like peptidoglycan-associated protein
MTQDELREAVLAALLDYETFKKTRRLKAVKKALRGTIMATVISSTSFTAANEVRSSQVRETATVMSSKPNAMSAIAKLPQKASQSKFIPAVAHFAFGRYTLAASQEERLLELIKQLPKDSEITVIGLTDSQGGHQYNKKLGRQRAQEVANYLTSHGMKIKAIENNISDNMSAAWMARRVDIVVDSASAPFFLNLTSVENQHSLQQTLSMSQTPLNAFDYHNNEKKGLQETEKRAVADSTKSAVIKSDADTVTAKSKPEQKSFQRQQIRDVTHFAFNRHTLASAHKERLLELIKQLPKEAELTVIGRTDTSGGDDYNKNLGMQRAKTVAIFLANHGVKVKAVGSKVSSEGLTGWAARHVDIVVDSALTPLTINLPPLITQKHIHRTEARPESQARLISSRTVHGIDQTASQGCRLNRYWANRCKQWRRLSSSMTIYKESLCSSLKCN